MTCSVKQLRLQWVGPLLFCGAEIGRVPTGISGVYILHAFEARHGWYPALYVGKTTQLNRRLVEHLAGSTTAPEIRLLRATARLFFSAAPVVDFDALNSVEAGLVAFLRPPFNRQLPSAPPVWTNLPAMVLE